MLPRNKRERRQSGGKIVVGDDRNLPVLSGQSGRSMVVAMIQHTGGIEETERVWVISNHDRNGIWLSGCVQSENGGKDIQLSKTVGTYSEGNLFVV